MAVQKRNIQTILTELRRELRTRRQVYPKWIRDGRITETVAQARIEIIEEAIRLIEDGYADQIERESMPLFHQAETQ